MNGRMAKRLRRETMAYCKHKGTGPGEGANMYVKQPKTGAVRCAWKWRVFYQARKRYHVDHRRASLASIAVVRGVV